jgi:uncharacterized membrane protein YccF (DUF307 family)
MCCVLSMHLRSFHLVPFLKPFSLGATGGHLLVPLWVLPVPLWVCLFHLGCESTVKNTITLWNRPTGMCYHLIQISSHSTWLAMVEVYQAHSIVHNRTFRVKLQYLKRAEHAVGLRRIATQ